MLLGLELRDEAREARKYTAAIMAEKNIGLVMGYYIERHEHGRAGEFDHLSRDEVQARLEALRAIKRASLPARDKALKLVE